MTKNTEVKNEVSAEQTLINSVLAISDTSKKIRFLGSQGMSVAQIYNFIKKFNLASTKAGGEIRYQHVRNVMMTKLSSN